MVKEAITKLNNEAKDANTAIKRIIEHLKKRVLEDEGLAEDVMNDKKNMDKCYSYISENARKQAKNNCACIEDETVYEWAEDYFRAEEKEEEKKPVETKTEKKPDKKAEAKARLNARATKKPEVKKPEPKKPVLAEPTEGFGQLSLF